MPSKYSRKNRDRRGGHKTSPITGYDFDFRVFAGPVMRADIKRITKKVARRQAKSAIGQAFEWEALADEQFDAIDIAESYADRRICALVGG